MKRKDNNKWKYKDLDPSIGIQNSEDIQRAYRKRRHTTPTDLAYYFNRAISFKLNSFFCYASKHIFDILKEMKRVGAIRDFYPVHKNVQKRAGIQRLEKELSRRFIFVILQDSLKYDLAVQEVYMMSFPGRRVNFAYKTVVELCQKKTGIFIFNTVDGVKAQDYLLQKKIGGSIICCIY